MLRVKKGWDAVGDITILTSCSSWANLRTSLLGGKETVKAARYAVLIIFFHCRPVSSLPVYIPDLAHGEEFLTAFLISGKHDHRWDYIIDKRLTFGLACSLLVTHDYHGNLSLTIFWEFWVSVKPVWRVICNNGKWEWTWLKKECEKLWIAVDYS